MYLDRFSYWLTVTGEDVEKAVELLRIEGTLAGGITKPGEAEFQVNEIDGTIDEWDDVDKVMLMVSSACPKAVFSLLSINEDKDGEERRSVYVGGSMIKESFSRKVGADERYDRRTAEDIVQALSAAGNAAAATMIEQQFLPDFLSEGGSPKQETSSQNRHLPVIESVNQLIAADQGSGATFSRIAEEVVAQISSDDDTPLHIGRDLWNAYCKNPEAADEVLTALSGWSMKSILTFAGLVKDDEGLILGEKGEEEPTATASEGPLLLLRMVNREIHFARYLTETEQLLPIREKIDEAMGEQGPYPPSIDLFLTKSEMMQLDNVLVPEMRKWVSDKAGIPYTSLHLKIRGVLCDDPYTAELGVKLYADAHRNDEKSNDIDAEIPR